MKELLLYVTGELSFLSLGCERCEVSTFGRSGLKCADLSHCHCWMNAECWVESRAFCL